MAKQKISVTIELDTASKLLEMLAHNRGDFSSKSQLIEHALTTFLENGEAGAK